MPMSTENFKYGHDFKKTGTWDAYTDPENENVIILAENEESAFLMVLEWWEGTGEWALELHGTLQQCQEKADELYQEAETK